MSKIERSVVIDRPVEEVWEFVHEVAKDPLWISSIVEAEQTSEGPMGVGTTARETLHFLGRRIETTWEMTEYEPMRRSSIKTTSGPIPLAGTYLLEPTDGGTRFTVTGELDAHGFFKLAEPVFARIAARELETNLGHLKDLLEAEG